MSVNNPDIKQLRLRAKALGYRLLKRGDFYHLKHGERPEEASDIEVIAYSIDLYERGGKWATWTACGMPTNDVARAIVAAGGAAPNCEKSRS